MHPFDDKIPIYKSLSYSGTSHYLLQRNSIIIMEWNISLFLAKSCFANGASQIVATRPKGGAI